ncbi:MAG: hypothetical protein NC231_08390 [Bacillus sp. (in: Bacteria)]|nr:hypothetical protein [Bacillus sp. (in: firmicutes)]MCM1428073.1 hypothetical protein [Eubacterium sp.]
MVEVNLQVIFGEYDCVAYTSIEMSEDYTMNQLIQAVRDRDYKKISHCGNDEKICRGIKSGGGTAVAPTQPPESSKRYNGKERMLYIDA